MKISAAKVTLTGQDLMSIVEDFVEVEGLKIEEIAIDEFVSVSGTYKMKINIPFNVQIGFGTVIDNIVNIKVMNVRVLNLGIFSGVKNMALKKFLKDFSEYGIKTDKDNISLDLVMISRLIPYVYFRLESIDIRDRKIVLDFEELIYAKDKETIKPEKKTEVERHIKISDKYSETRGKIVGNVPDKYQKIADYALMLPDMVTLLYRLFKDDRVKIDVKIKVAAIIAYLASPIDILPDFIPMIGRVDDVALAFFALNAIMNEIPEEIIVQNWQGKENIIKTVREAVNYMAVTLGSENVAKLARAVKKAFSPKKKKKKKEETENAK